MSAGREEVGWLVGWSVVRGLCPGRARAVSVLAIVSLLLMRSASSGWREEVGVQNRLSRGHHEAKDCINVNCSRRRCVLEVTASSTHLQASVCHSGQLFYTRTSIPPHSPRSCLKHTSRLSHTLIQTSPKGLCLPCWCWCWCWSASQHDQCHATSPTCSTPAALHRPSIVCRPQPWRSFDILTIVVKHCQIICKPLEKQAKGHHQVVRDLAMRMEQAAK